jgi:N-hydroxyarylamine O-acetyltransferase
MSFDLEGYLERIGAAGSTDLHTLHRAHVASIPFENLDPHRGIPVSLEPRDLERKLVAQRRGGYCFEQNLLFKAALEAVGLQAEPMLARVRYGAPPGAVRPRSHLLLRVQAGGAVWHADVGFGNGTPMEPLPWGRGGEHEITGWRFRIVEDGDELVLQTKEASEWKDLYAFLPRPVPLVDIETSNWFTSTYPRSMFVTGLVAAAQRPDGSRVTLSDWSGTLTLTERTPERTEATPVGRDAVPELLRTRFELPGFSIAADGSLQTAG